MVGSYCFAHVIFFLVNLHTNIDITIHYSEDEDRITLDYRFDTVTGTSKNVILQQYDHSPQ